MQFLKFTNDYAVRRLSLVLVAIILFTIMLTLEGQPDSFWQNPETAIRDDGLSIYNLTNHSFAFYLGKGWLIYLFVYLIYFSAVFLLISFLPKTVSLIIIFTFLFGYYFAGCNWLAVRWHMGVKAPMIYGISLAIAITIAAYNKRSKNDELIIHRLRWLMIGAILLDVTNTLLGQPSAYWHNTQNVHEANLVSRFFLLQGWYAYLFMELIYCAVLYWLVSVLPKKWAILCNFYFILVSYIGASNWFFYQWRMGRETPVIYGCILSLLIILLSFFQKFKMNK